MKRNGQYDVIIIGGSYSGLAAAMALGRALRNVLVVDSGRPCNRQTPHSHNFLTQDGRTPAEISVIGRQQVEAYTTVQFVNDLAISGAKTKNGFAIGTEQGDIYRSRKLVFATGIRDIIPTIEGFAESWGISVLHCPYCHGYEVRNEVTGILGNGEYGFDFSKLISNWTKDLTLFTNGPSSLTKEQTMLLVRKHIQVVEKEIRSLNHRKGHVHSITFQDGTGTDVRAIYTRTPFEQHSDIPQNLGCEMTEEGYIRIDPTQHTSIKGVFACGDNTTRMRTVANAVAMGTAAGMMVNKELVEEDFNQPVMQ